MRCIQDRTGIKEPVLGGLLLLRTGEVSRDANCDKTTDMDFRLKPELEKLVEEDVQRGPYQTADEFVERAVLLLHEHEA